MKLPPGIKHQIVESMKLVDGSSVYGYAIAEFVSEIEQKEDHEILQAVLDIKDSIKDNAASMRKTLGDAYNFFNNVDLEKDLVEVTTTCN